MTWSQKPDGEPGQGGTLLSLPRYHAPPTPIRFTETTPSPLTPIRSVSCIPAAHPRHSLPALLSLAKWILVIIRAKS